MTPARVVVFIDYQNLHASALDCFWPRNTHPSQGHIDPIRLGRLIVAKRSANAHPSRLVQVRVYRGRPSPHRQPAAAAAGDRQADAWSRSPLAVVKRRPLRYPRGWPAVPPQEKGIDVALAVDIVRMGIEGAFDVCALVSGDADLLPAIETIMELRCGHVEVAAWRGGGRLMLPGTSLPWCHWMDEADYRSVEDLTDYSKRP
ncbi:NYN domain-containing protein [Spongiactinospora rosea]|uniref:NYN domain-containing protein n=1 Tax=Spongiactinospora rosea TaxID=2248750 RepID=A0A366LXU8_9ACTN|nr:NYN domain-containing protein [Spongiactinospora rosea]RBQ18179.1 NYN domain-containing protein [Spongiactinospora rosea]